VSGFDTTKDFAMTAYSNDDASFESDLSISVPARDSTSTSSAPTRASVSTFFLRWRVATHLIPTVDRSNASPHRLHGCLIRPRNLRTRNPFPMFATNVSSFAITLSASGWVFFPVLIRAAAGPHDLGPGNNHDDTFPELMARQDPAPNHEDDPTSGAEDVHSDPNNGPNVWCSSWPLVHALIFDLRARGTTSLTSLRIMYSR
jgi:hypothetical protein